MNKKEKIILFGASRGGENFIKHNKTQYDILAIADNDEKRWGSLLEGLKVINPKDILKYDFDNIYITSQWVDSIIYQLTEDFKIPLEKIKIPKKSSLKESFKPFEHVETLKFARESLCRITQFLSNHNIIAIVDSGTALGIVRDKDLIRWDDDIDFAIDSKDFEKLISLVDGLRTILPKNEYSKWKLEVISLSNDDVCLSLELQSSDLNMLKEFEISLQKRTIKDGLSHLDSSAGIFYAPALHFEKYERVDFFDGFVYLPYKVDDFLTFMYGNYKEPKKDTSIENYDNRVVQKKRNIKSFDVRKRVIL